MKPVTTFAELRKELEEKGATFGNAAKTAPTPGMENGFTLLWGFIQEVLAILPTDEENAAVEAPNATEIPFRYRVEYRSEGVGTLLETRQTHVFCDRDRAESCFDASRYGDVVELWEERRIK